MSAFHTHMTECRRTKQAARNRGQSIGDHRGTLRPRPLPEQPEWWLEAAFAEIARDLAWQNKEQAEMLSWIIAHNNDATLADLAAMF
jgi:uncharacterized protein (DUF2235 family)